MPTKEVESMAQYDILPEEYKAYVGGFCACAFDAVCGEPIGWGYYIQQKLGNELWGRISAHGEMWCSYPEWYLVTHWLTPDEAMEKYGEITKQDRGPRGGFRSVTFGSKTFCSKHLDPLAI